MKFLKKNFAKQFQKFLFILLRELEIQHELIMEQVSASVFVFNTICDVILGKHQYWYLKFFENFCFCVGTLSVSGVIIVIIDEEALIV